MSEAAAAPSDLAALETFVAECDELRDLEALIGRFNIFDALGVVEREINHSNFLAWLLDPSESHGQGPLFLKAVLMDLLRQSPPDKRLFSPIALDGGELRGVEVRREWNHIDILIVCQEPAFAIAVENKVRAKQGRGQLKRYRAIMASEFAHHRRQYVFLTREGDEPIDDNWTTYTYADLHRVLERVRASNIKAIGDDVAAFLDHYLSLIGSRFMDDPKIDELCETIYKNHRRAIDLIVERIGTNGSGAIGAIAEEVSKTPGWIVTHRGPTYVEFIPTSWQNLLPPLGKRKVVLPEQWLSIWFRVGKKQCYCVIKVATATDAVLRRKVIERLVADPSEFGLKSLFKSVELIGDDWATLGRINVDRWNPDEGPDLAKLLPKVRAVLDKRAKQLAGVPDALRPIIEAWERTKKVL
jgi:hypothetical protein